MRLSIKSVVQSLMALGLTSASLTAWSLPTDQDQPIQVQADSAEMDDAKGLAVYRGNVIITQGTLKVTGNTVTITRDKEGNLDVMTAFGGPAYYEQIPGQKDPKIQAYGLKMQYFLKKDQIVLIDQAKVIQDGNIIVGEKIVYNTKTRLASAGRATKTAITSPQPRVNLTLPPKKKTAQPAPQQAKP